MQVSIIIPTLNEHGNIVRLIERINLISAKNNLNYEIIIVDDNSTDGTIEDIKRLQKNQDNIKLIVREKPMGIGSAHIVGYNLAQGDLIISLDADLSHPPEAIPEFIKKIDNKYDLAVSSRYMRGGVTDKNTIHNLISKFGSFYLSILFGIKIKDFSTGYRAIKKEIWEKIKNYKYSTKNNFLIESVYFAYENGAKITDVPIIFKERVFGKSKTPVLRESFKALILPFKLRLIYGTKGKK